MTASAQKNQLRAPGGGGTHGAAELQTVCSPCRLRTRAPGSDQSRQSPFTERAFERWWMAIEKRDGVVVLVELQVPLSTTHAAVCGSMSWWMLNSDPFAPSLIPSIWPPKVTFRHGPLEEGCLIAFLLCRRAWLLPTGYSKLISREFFSVHTFNLLHDLQ